MNVSGFSSATRCPSSRSSAIWPWNFPFQVAPWRRALVDHHPADVVAMAGVAAARIAEADDEQIERRGAFAPAPGEAH